MINRNESRLIAQERRNQAANRKRGGQSRSKPSQPIKRHNSNAA